MALRIGKQTQRKDFAMWLALITGLFLLGPIANAFGLTTIGETTILGIVSIYTMIGLFNLLIFVWYWTKEL